MLDHFGNMDWSWLIESFYIWTATYTEQLHKSTIKHYSNWDPKYVPVMWLQQWMGKKHLLADVYSNNQVTRIQYLTTHGVLTIDQISQTHASELIITTRYVSYLYYMNNIF